MSFGKAKLTASAALLAAIVPVTSHAVAIHHEQTYTGILSGRSGAFETIAIDVLWDNRPEYQNRVGRIRFDIIVDGSLSGHADSGFPEQQRIVGLDGDVSIFFTTDQSLASDIGAASLLDLVAGQPATTVPFGSGLRRTYSFDKQILPDQLLEATLMRFRIVAGEVEDDFANSLTASYQYRVSIRTDLDFKQVFQVAAPAPLALFGMGLAALAAARRRGTPTA